MRTPRYLCNVSLMTTTSTTSPAPIDAQVALFRHANSRIRTMVKGGGANGRNAGATAKAIARCQAVAEQAMRQIVASGERRIAGDLTEEASVIDNIAASVTDRPELQWRLVTLRRNVRRRVQHLQDAR